MGAGNGLMGLLKYDYPPLLAPGRHFLCLSDIEELCVSRFTESDRAYREKLFYSFEDFYQRLLVAKIPCDVVVDGSFVTEKPRQIDVDVKVYIDYDAHCNLDSEQQMLVDSINEEIYIDLVDSTAYIRYPREHECFGTGLDLGNQSEDYGLEHSETWLKGYAVLMLWETDVGIRIRSRTCSPSIRFSLAT